MKSNALVSSKSRPLASGITLKLEWTRLAENATIALCLGLTSFQMSTAQRAVRSTYEGIRGVYRSCSKSANWRLELMRMRSRLAYHNSNAL